MATAAKKKAAGGSRAKKPLPAKGKPKAPPQGKKAAAAAPKKKAPDGTKQDWMTGSGQMIEGVYKDGHLCCTYCERKLPQYTTEAQRRIRALERRGKLEERGRLVFRDIADTLRKNAERAGQKPPTDAEIMAKLLSPDGIEEAATEA